MQHRKVIMGFYHGNHPLPEDMSYDIEWCHGWTSKPLPLKHISIYVAMASEQNSRLDLILNMDFTDDS